MVSRTLFVPVAFFFAVAAIVYLSTLVKTSSLLDGFLVPQLVSVVFLLPLVYWYRSNRASHEANIEQSSTLGRVLVGSPAIYLLIMTVRIPAVAFLQFPLEKTPLIYLLVLTAFLVERRPVAGYGFTLERLRRQLTLGGVLLLVNLIVPATIIVSAIAVVYSVNAFSGYDLVAFSLSIPFQVLAVGISEEGFFRGYMQTRLSKVTGARRAILFQATLFGLWHFVWHINPLDWGGMALHIGSTFVFGLLTGTYYRYTSSIAGLALFHGLSNSLGAGFNPNLSRLPFSTDSLLVIFVVAELVSTGVLILIARRISLSILGERTATSEGVISSVKA